MGTRIRAYNFAALALLTPLWCIGCKDREPTPMLSQDLGVEGKPLVLPPAPFHNVNIQKGKADWVPFREPGTEPEPVVEDAPTRDTPPTESPAIEEIKSLIADYNNLSDENDFEEMKTYIVESQIEAMTAAFTTATDMRKKIIELKNKLSEKLTEETERIETTLAKITVSADLATGARLSTTTITEVNADEVMAMTSPGSLTSSLKFVIEEDAWYLKFSDLADAKTLTEQLSSKVSSYGGMLSQLADGSTTAKQILTSMEETLAAEVKMAEPHHDGHEDNDGSLDDDDHGDHEEEHDEDEAADDGDDE